MKTAFILLMAAVAMMAGGCHSTDTSPVSEVQPYSSTPGPTPAWPPPAPDTMDNPNSVPANPAAHP